MKTTLIIVKNKSVLTEVANNYLRSETWTYTSNTDEFTNGTELHQLMTQYEAKSLSSTRMYDEVVTL